MLKLVVFSVLVAFVLAGVVPKPPAVHTEKKDESPSVKGVPLHSAENYKPVVVKHELKHGEENKQQEKSAKKEEHLDASPKKADQHGHQDAVKPEVSSDVHGKMLNKDQPAPSVKDSHKAEKVEVVKPKSHEPGH